MLAGTRRGLAPLAMLLLALEACTGGGAAGPAPECVVPADCPGGDSECQQRTCSAGRCGVAHAQPLIPCGTPGMACDGAGACLDPCAPNPCTAPPASSCANDVATIYPSVGTCTRPQPGVAACDYTPDVFDCTITGEHCLAGACVPGPQATSQEIANLRTEVEACVLPPCQVGGPVERATVTYVRQAAAGIQPGFFLQAEQAGPALFVGIVPESLVPRPAPGDLVSFMVTQAGLFDGVLTVTQLTAWQRLDVGRPLAPLVQDLSAAADLLPVGTYTGELATVAALVSGPFTAGDFPMVLAPVQTAGYPAGAAQLKLMLPDALRSARDVAEGCEIEVGPAPFLQRIDTALAVAWTDADLRVLACPAPRLVRAQPRDATHVTLSFDRNLDPASVSPGGEQFAVEGGLASVAVNGVTVAGRQVELTTAPMTPAVTHTVAVAGTVLDLLGSGVDQAAASASFAVPAPGCQAWVVVSQLYGGGGVADATYDVDFVELHNRTGVDVDLTGWSLQYAVAAGTSWLVRPLGGTIPAGGWLLVQAGGGPGPNGAPLPTPDLVWTSALSAIGGKVALVRSITALSGACPGGTVDLVGYGSATCAEGGGATAPAMSATLALQRGGSGCADTDDNATDFTAATPAPRNGATAALVCPCDGL